MAEKTGWISIHRKIQDCWIWQVDKPFDERSAWIDLLLTANHKDVKIPFNGELTLVKRSQLITSVRKLSERWKWNKDKVLKFLKLLESDGMIKRESDKLRTLITIENYTFYQDGSDTERTPLGTQQGTLDGHQPATNNNVNNDNNIYICSNSLSESDSDDKKSKQEELEKNFQILYDSYPKKKGRTEAFSRYKLWVTTGKDVNGKKVKVTNKQIWDAIAKYKREMEQKETDLQFYKNFDTFLGKQLLDYVEDEE